MEKLVKVVGVTFKDYGRKYFFDVNNLNVKKNITVIVDTERGLQFGKIVTDVLEVSNDEFTSPLKKVIRISTKKDYNNYLTNLKDAKIALDYARECVKKANLDMKLLDAIYTLDRKQLMFNFIADERIDFRDVVKEIAAKYKTRIELHQIGVRDKSKEIGGLGQCGRPLCCASFLNGIDTISISMAKNQNIALNPNKINGACGRLLCCLAYEDEVYTCHRKLLPKVGEYIETPDGKGRVVSIDVLNKKYTVEINGDKCVYESSRIK